MVALLKDDGDETEYDEEDGEGEGEQNGVSTLLMSPLTYKVLN